MAIYRQLCRTCLNHFLHRVWERRDWFAGQEQMGARRQWKVALLVAAIGFANTVDYGSRGVPPITAFWRQYWLLASGKAPDLRMREPGPKAGGFLYFNPEGLLSRLKLVHRLTRGRVDLQFSGMAGSRGLIETQFGSLLRPNMHVARAGKSAVVQICVPPLDLMSDFSDQESSALKGLMAAWELWDWFLQNRLQILDFLRASMPGRATVG